MDLINVPLSRSGILQDWRLLMRKQTEDLQLKDRESVLKAKDGSVKGYIPEKKAKRSCKGGWDGGEGGIMV